MKTKVSIICLLLAFSLSHAYSQFFDRADSFLKKYVKDGRVAYSAIKNNPGEIEYLYEYVGSADTEKMTPQERKAFYINAYNLIVIYQVSMYYPLKSPMDASGFFDAVKHKVAGEQLTLNALEIKKLLNEDGDARIHFALACAAKSCPKLASFAYQPSILDKQLTERTRLSVNDPEWLIVDKKSSTVRISKIFDWYERDFKAGAGGVREFINTYRKEPVPGKYELEYYEYNWELND